MLFYLHGWMCHLLTYWNLLLIMPSIDKLELRGEVRHFDVSGRRATNSIKEILLFVLFLITCDVSL